MTLSSTARFSRFVDLVAVVVEQLQFLAPAMRAERFAHLR